MKTDKRLDFATYQRQAAKTSKIAKRDGDAVTLSLLGIMGELGSLAAEQKKRLRDGARYRFFREKVGEDLGDLLWYLASFASAHGLDLEEVARQNLAKIEAVWLPSDDSHYLLFDAQAPTEQQLPRHFDIEFRQESGVLRIFWNGEQKGNDLTDNNYSDDGYRYHDVFHLAYAAVLGWSPVTRAVLRRKRKYKPELDEVEDGGRAIVVEEGISQLVYTYAKSQEFLETDKEIDRELLHIVRRMSEHLEVRARSEADWERAIHEGFRVWRELRSAGEGRVTVDLAQRKVFFSTLPARVGSPKPTATPGVVRASSRTSNRRSRATR